MWSLLVCCVIRCPAGQSLAKLWYTVPEYTFSTKKAYRRLHCALYSLIRYYYICLLGGAFLLSKGRDSRDRRTVRQGRFSCSVVSTDGRLVNFLGGGGRSIPWIWTDDPIEWPPLSKKSVSKNWSTRRRTINHYLIKFQVHVPCNIKA